MMEGSQSSAGDLENILARWESVCAEMKSLRTKSAFRDRPVRLLLITKSVDAESISQASRWGQKEFGENYLQEALSKRKTLESYEDLPLKSLHRKLSWHFVGRIQSNKISKLVGNFTLLHSVDRVSVAEKISSQALSLGTVQSVLAEVNLAGETTKAGFSPEFLLSNFRDLLSLKGLCWRGLMCFPPATGNSHVYFRDCERLRQELIARHSQSGFKENFCELSMGTSGDWRAAVHEGATWVRLGTAIFGERRLKN